MAGYVNRLADGGMPMRGCVRLVVADARWSRSGTNNLVSLSTPLSFQHSGIEILKGAQE